MDNESGQHAGHYRIAAPTRIRKQLQPARLAGADRADVVHFSDIVAAKVRLSEYQFLVFPGGFLDGDDLGAAQAAAQRWLHLSDAEGQPLLDSLNRFVDAGGLVLGICNGFQLLVKLGVLPALDGKRFEAAGFPQP